MSSDTLSSEVQFEVGVRFGTIVGIAGIYAGRRAPIYASRLTIGRDQSNNLAFAADTTVSRYHAVLFFEEDQWFCVDAGSTNGTYLDSVRVDSNPTPICSSATIRFGSQELSIEYNQPSRFGEEVSQRKARADSDHTSVALADVATSMDWIGPGENIQLHDLSISNPLIYIGSFQHHMQEFWDPTPFLVDPKLPIDLTGLAPELDTYPSYAFCRPEQRAIYLRWLASGRSMDVHHRYLILFFYGLEFRLLGPKSTTVDLIERTAIFEELDRLNGQFPEAARFQRLSGQLKAIHWPSCGQLLNANSIHPSDRWQLAEKDWSWLLACLLHHKRQLDGDISVVFLTNMRRRVAPKTVVNRCWPEILELFRLRFDSAHPDGIHLTNGDRMMSYSYEAANYYARPELGVQKRLRCVSNEKEILADLEELALRCIRDLEPYSKQIGKGTLGESISITQAELPRELLVRASEADKLAQRLREFDGEGIGTTTFGALLQAWAGGVEVSKRSAASLAMVIEKLGYIMEPDVRYGASVPQDSSAVCIAKLANDDMSTPSREYLAVAPLAQLAAAIATADGLCSTSETEVFRRYFRSRFNLTATDLLRLDLNFQSFAARNQRINKRTVDNIPNELKNEICRFLVEVAQADGSISAAEVRELVHLGELMGIEQETLYSMIHSGDELTPITGVSRGSEFSIPGVENANHTPLVDMNAVSRKLADTERVSKLLASIFAQDEEPISVSKSIASSMNGMSELLKYLNTGSISRRDFAALAERAGLMAGLAYEQLNECAQEKCDSLLLEGDDPITVHPDVLAEMQA
ncbi:MAG: TerB N-terminal domain-containing protein [Fimbriimonadales bacterium]